jgi:hypothetical protein
MVLHEQRLIDLAEYARIVSRLTVWKHDHVSLNSVTLMSILELDEHADAFFDAATEFIGGERAEILSHIGVAADFLNDVWSVPIPSWRKGRAAGRVLSQLLKNRADWREVLGTVIGVIPNHSRRLTSRADLAMDYLANWVRGHFLEPSRRAKKSDPRRGS